MSYEDEEEKQAAKELERELGEGEEAAWLLVRHLQRMGVDCGKIPLIVEGKNFLITVEKL